MNLELSACLGKTSANTLNFYTYICRYLISPTWYSFFRALMTDILRRAPVPWWGIQSVISNSISEFLTCDEHINILSVYYSLSDNGTPHAGRSMYCFGFDNKLIFMQRHLLLFSTLINNSHNILLQHYLVQISGSLGHPLCKEFHSSFTPKTYPIDWVVSILPGGFLLWCFDLAFSFDLPGSSNYTPTSVIRFSCTFNLTFYRKQGLCYWLNTGRFYVRHMSSCIFLHCFLGNVKIKWARNWEMAGHFHL